MSSEKATTMLVDSVHLSFGERTVLQSVYLTAEKGKVTGVLGRNGSGKSCLFRCIMGALKPLNMFVRFGEQMKTDYAHIGERVRFLPQYQFSPAKMTLGEAFRLYGVDYDGLVTFDEKYHRYQRKTFAELSGGEARLAEIYMVLCSESEFCILDEPFSYLSPLHVEKLRDLIATKKEDKGIIVSDHQYEEIIGMSDDLFLLKDGYTFPIKSREDLITHGYIYA